MRGRNLVAAATFGVLIGTAAEAQQNFDCRRQNRANGAFTLICDRATGGGGGGGGGQPADFAVQNVRKYDARIDEADWIYFDIKANRNLPRFTLTVRLHWPDGTFTNCREYVPALERNQREEGLIIPDVCASDRRWTAVQFIKPAGRTCSGCRRYNANSLPYGQSLRPGASDTAIELEDVIQEIEYGHALRGQW